MSKEGPRCYSWSHLIDWTAVYAWWQALKSFPLKSSIVASSLHKTSLQQVVSFIWKTLRKRKTSFNMTRLVKTHISRAMRVQNIFIQRPLNGTRLLTSMLWFFFNPIESISFRTILEFILTSKINFVANLDNVLTSFFAPVISKQDSMI